ncbi:MAG: thioether cross-link-forming SCIFF peptide maturase [Defluviitaleaceae bacterium]|nr:thioether cross-link-forming SCIFF peptide maturase [Defluviitaleaceae bacterium]
MIHKYRLGGYNIVMDVNSGAIHCVDDLAFDTLDGYTLGEAFSPPAELLERYTAAEIEEAVGEIGQLVREGLLFSDEDYEWATAAKGGAPLKAICLHVAHDCNLRCGYCFAGEGEYKGARALMSAETARRAIDFLVENSRGRRELEVDFFGGEPLLNFDTVKQTVAYARSLEEPYDKNFRFTITTNGMMLNDEIETYINEEMYNVVLSLDGRKSVNDGMRKTLGGGSSYDAVVPKFQKLVKSRAESKYRSVYLRGTFTHDNLDFARDVIHMCDLGFRNVSVEPVVAEASESFAIREEDLPRIFDEYEALAGQLPERDGLNFFHFNIDLSGGPCVIKRLTGCGAGTEYLAVTPEGHIYPCHQFVGREPYMLGNLDEGVANTQLRDRLGALNVYTKPDCVDCWAKFHCGGGCAANSLTFGGDLRAAYKIGCDMHRKRVECAIMMKVAEEAAQ